MKFTFDARLEIVAPDQATAIDRLGEHLRSFRDLDLDHIARMDLDTAGLRGTLRLNARADDDQGVQP